MSVRLSHLLRYAVLCPLSCFLLLHVFTIRTFASSSPITVTSQNDLITFPKSIDFQISATDSSSPITGAILTLKFGENGMQEQRFVSLPTPSTNAMLHWQEDTTKNNSFAPTGTNVYYSWKLQDSAGHTYIDTMHTFMVVDSRFSWQHLNQGLLQINWYKRPASFGQAVLQDVDTDLSRITANLGGTLTHPLTLWVYQNTTDFHGSLPPDTHEWVGGIAFPDLNTASIVAEDTESDTLVRDMPHELTHLLFHQIISQGIYAPVWFDEGLAVYNQIYHEPEMSLRLKRALQAHNLIHLSDISLEFPADADQAYLAYAESWNLVDYMYSTFSRAKMAALIKAMNSPATDFNTDLHQAIGIDEIQLENQWRAHLNQPPVLVPQQVNTTPAQSQPLQVNTPTDNTIPFIFLLGLLMIILPTVGLTIAFVRRHNQQTQKKITRQAQQIINQSLPPRYPPIQPQLSHTSSTPYGNSRQQYYPTVTPDPTHSVDIQRRKENLYSTVQNQSYSPLHKFSNIYDQPYPDDTSADDVPFQSLAPGQEYLLQHPPKQAPQE